MYVRLGEAGRVLNVPAEALEERINELPPQLRFIVLTRRVRLAVQSEPRDEIEDFFGRAHGFASVRIAAGPYLSLLQTQAQFVHTAAAQSKCKECPQQRYHPWKLPCDNFSSSSVWNASAPGSGSPISAFVRTSLLFKVMRCT
jgi:hypothetical protein